MNVQPRFSFRSEIKGLSDRARSVFASPKDCYATSCDAVWHPVTGIGSAAAETDILQRLTHSRESRALRGGWQISAEVRLPLLRSFFRADRLGPFSDGLFPAVS